MWFEAIEIGPFIIWTRLIFVLVGIWLATDFFLRLAQSANLSLQTFQDDWWQYLLGFVLGSRVFAILASYRVYFHDFSLESIPRLFILWDGGFSFLGGAIGVGVVLYLATRAQRSIFLQWLDALVPATTLGLFFAWLGAFFAGQQYGRPTDLFFGITYDAMNVRYAVPIHPVQVYYALFYLVLTFLLLIIRKRAARVGSETLFGIIIACIGTFVLEYFRGDLGIPVFATKLDFVVLLVLFLSLGIFTAIEVRLPVRTATIWQVIIYGLTAGYLLLRPWLDLEMFELRFNQFLAILSLLGTVVYVVIQRRKHPHL